MCKERDVWEREDSKCLRHQGRVDREAGTLDKDLEDREGLGSEEKEQKLIHGGALSMNCSGSFLY